jgi:hypothetical protein
VYVVDAVSPVSLYELPDEVAILVLGVQEPVQRKILYPARPDPPLSVEAVQERLICDAEVEVALSPVGVVGAVLSTTIDVVNVDVPYAFVAVRV